MTPELLKTLRCPYCGSDLTVWKVNQTSNTSIDFGVLKCSECAQRYPIVAGIPILFAESERVHVRAETTDAVGFAGPLNGDVVYQLTQDQPGQAFATLIRPPVARLRLAHLPWLRRVPSLQRLVHGLEEKATTARAKVWRRRLLRRLGALGKDTTAVSILELYYRDWYHMELGNYFIFRFGQPRHLVALALTSILAPLEGPVLDLACGVGHLSHYLTSQNRHRHVVGLDRNFFQLYVAKTVAPAADLVCCNADSPLPFVAGGFSAVVCSDAFHYFLNRVACAREVERVLRSDGVAVITRVGNVRVAPHEGYELSGAGYRRLFSLPSALVTENAVLARYLRKMGPDLGGDTPALEDAKWLSLVATRRPEVLQQHGPFADWPHAAGRLRLNPLYQEVGRDGNDVTFQFVFPSQHYGSEDAAYRSYAPDQVSVPQHQLDLLAAGQRTPDMEDLIARCVVVGMPDRYV